MVIDIDPVAQLKRPVTLGEIKANRLFADFPLVRMPRLSVMPVGDHEWREIRRMASA